MGRHAKEDDDDHPRIGNAVSFNIIIGPSDARDPQARSTSSTVERFFQRFGAVTAFLTACGAVIGGVVALSSSTPQDVAPGRESEWEPPPTVTPAPESTLLNYVAPSHRAAAPPSTTTAVPPSTSPSSQPGTGLPTTSSGTTSSAVTTSEVPPTAEPEESSSDPAPGSPPPAPPTTARPQVDIAAMIESGVSEVVASLTNDDQGGGAVPITMNGP